MIARGSALVLVALVVSGCVALPAPTPSPTPATPSMTTRNDSANTGSVPVDAVVAVARADELAQAWSIHATLRAILGTEGVYAQPDDPPYSYDTSSDPAIGDGLALAWTYVYAAPEQNGTFVVTIAGDDSVLYHREVSSDRPQPVGPGNGPVVRPFNSSSNAALAVMANDTAKRFVADHPTTFVHMALLATPDGSEWTYSRATTSGFFLLARINATSSQLIDISDGPRMIVDPPFPTPPPCMGCPPGPRGTPPPLPPPEDTRKNVTLNAFNTAGDMGIAPSQIEFAYNLTVAADVPGSTPLDARTLTLTSPQGDVLASKSGTGHLEIDISDPQQAMPPGAPYHLSISSQTPPAQDQVIELSSHIVYTRYIAYTMRGYLSGGGSASFQQTSDSTMRLPSNSTADLHVSFASAGPASPPATAPGSGTTWQILDPKGSAIANGTSEDGAATFPTGAGGEFTLRVLGGSEAAFGESYRYSVALSG